ncbi:MAG TPA: LamG domain-containing protein [Verrucomicrobiae bacterium]|nr:LamG domain-containing protein [Verrucomicrobiae bacterium]
MDEGTGTSAEDATGNGVTGTLTNGPTWVEGYSSAGAVSAGDPSDSPAWAMPGYQFREQVKVANASGSTLPTGYAVNAPTSRATKLNANQTRADGNDWRMVHQPTDATRSLSFDGSNDDVTIPYSSLVDFDYNNPFTVSVWMKAGATQANTGLTYNYIAQRRLGAAGSQSFYLAINNQGAAIPGTIRAGRYESGHNPEITSTKTLNDSKWHLLTFTKVSSTLTLYIDGVAEASTTDTTTTDTSDVTDLCWAASCTSGRWFQGGLDDARVYNKGLSASEAAALYSGGSGSTGAVTSGLVGWWRFDEGSGQVLQDSSGNGLHGLVGDTSASTTTDPSWSTDGVVSTAYEVPRHIPKAHALRFDLADGTSEDSVGFSDNNAADIRTGSMSWSMWFRAAASGADQILYRKADSSFAKGCVIKLTTSNALQLSCGNTAGTLLATITTTQTTYTNGSWYHVTGVLNRATQELGLYVNGQLVQTGSAANLSTDDLNAASFFQLSGRSGSSDYFNGWMSDVRVYNYALPTGKINQIYNGGQGTVGVPESGLVAGWRLDEGTGTSVADYSGNAITGTLKSDQVTTGNGTSAGPIWQANLAPTASTTQTYFQTIAPIANSANSTDYYLYYGKADEKGSAFASPQPTRTGLLFDGTDDTVSVADNDTLDIGTGSMTWSLWFKSSTSGTVKYLYRKAGTNGTGGMLLSIGSGDKLTAQVRDSGGFSSYFATSTVSVTDGNWHLATAVVDRTANFLRVYVDGGNVVSTDISILTGDDLNTSASVILGGSSTVYHNGSMDDVQVHSRALSATEIADSYANAAPVSSANKVLHWKMDEGTGSTLTDSTATGLTGALNSFNFTPSSGWVHNENLWKASSAPTITAFSSDSEVPRFFQYRAVTNPVAPSGSWSALQPIGMAPVALGATGVKLKWNPVGMYRRYDTFAVSSWVVEAYSTSSPQRGKRRSFPEKANIVGNDSAVDIIDAQTNKLWMRIPGGVGTTQLSTVPVKQVAALNGRLYVTKTSANHTQVVDLQTDIFRTHHSSGNAFGTVAIAGRAGSGTGTYAGSALSSGSSVTNVAVQVLGTPPKTYVAYGINGGSTSSGVDVVVNETANTRHGLTTTDSPVRHYALAANSTYKSVLLTSAGTLYAANGTAGGVDRWDTIQSDTGDQVGTADRTYSTASTPALRNNTVNSLSVSTGTSQADYTSNTLAVGTSVGVDLVSEHTSQASSIITRYTPTGSVGTSKWNSEGFGGVVDFTGSSAVNIPHSTVFDPGVADFTAEGWFKTTQSCASSCMLIQRRNGAAGILVNLDSSNYLSASVRISTTDYTTTSLATVNDGIWHHFALVRVGTSISQYLDGVLQQITTNAGISASISNTDALRLGRNGTTGNNFNGYLDEVRLSNSARYTAAFTPSNREFVVDANTLGLWHLNNPAGQYVMDASTNANHGTVGTDNTVSSDDPYLVSPSLAGTAKVSAVALLHSSDTGKGLSFDGSADYVSVPDNANLDFAYNQDFSVGVWIKAPSTQANTGTTYNNIIHKWNGSGVVGYPYTLRIQNQTSGTAGKITAFRSDDLSNNPSLSSTVTVNDNLWHHVAFVKSGSTLRLYVDGVANGSTTDTTTGDTTNASPLTIGARGTNYFQGSLDEVRIYSAALSGANVAALYNGGRGWNGSPETGLVGGWHFNEGSGQTVADHSATANGGTLGADSTASSDDPTWITSSPVRSQPMLWVATNDAAADDGGITAVSLISNRRVTSFSTSDSSLPDNDVTSLSVGTGGLALTGTEAGAWSVGAAGAALDPAYLLTLSSATDARIQLPAGTIRLKDGTIHLK